MCNETLLFKGGIVRIDESHVWRSLSAWLSGGPSREVRMRRSDAVGDYSCELSEDGVKTVGRSRLGVGDAIAQALQIVETA